MNFFQKDNREGGRVTRTGDPGVFMCLLAGILLLIQSEFCRSDPIRSGSIRSDPVLSGPIRSGPVRLLPTAKFKQYCDLTFSVPYSWKTEKEQASFILLCFGMQGLRPRTGGPGTTLKIAINHRKYGSDSNSTWCQKSTTGWQDINYNN